MLKQMITGLSALILMSAPFSSAQAALLAKIEADVDGSGVKKTVELTGDKKMTGSNYYSNLWIVVKDSAGKMTTAWKPDLDGGYYCLLETLPTGKNEKSKAVRVAAKAGEKTQQINQKELNAEEKTAKPLKEGPAPDQAELQSATDRKTAGKKKDDTDEQIEALLAELKKATEKVSGVEKEKTEITDKPHDQILLMAAKGGKNAAVGCRIVDFSDRKKVREVFSGADALGITAKAEYRPGYTFTVECKLKDANDGEKTVSFSGKAENLLHLYRGDGSIAKTYLRPQVTEVVSLTRLADRLFTEQNILAANRRDLLGRLAVRWVQKEGRWIPEEVTLVDTRDEQAENAGEDRAEGAGNWKLYPRRAFIGDRSICRPVIAIEEKPDLQNKINKTLADWFEKAPEEDERAFQVKFAGPNLLSLELGRRNRDGEVIRDLYNIDMRNGAMLKMADMFNTKNPDFIKVLNLAGRPKDAFVTEKPAFWHFTGKYYILQDRLLAEHFQDEDKIHMTMITAEDMAPFLKDKKVVEK